MMLTIFKWDAAFNKHYFCPRSLALPSPPPVSVPTHSHDDEVLLDDTVVGETSHGGDVLLGDVVVGGGAVAGLSLLSYLVHLLVDLGTVEEPGLTCTGNSPLHTGWVPGTDASHLVGERHRMEETSEEHLRDWCKKVEQCNKYDVCESWAVPGFIIARTRLFYCCW